MEFCIQKYDIHATDAGRRWGGGETLRSIAIDHPDLQHPIQIYRCYVVWQSWWITVFPIMLWISVAGKSIFYAFRTLWCSREPDMTK